MSFAVITSEFKRLRIVTLGELRRQIDTIRDASDSSGELEEQRRRDLPFTAGSTRAINNVHLNIIHDLHTLHRDTLLNDLHSGRGRITNSRERNDANASLLWERGELQRSLSDDTERTLGANKHSGEVVAGGSLAGTSAGFDDAAIGQDDREVNHPVLHGTVADGVGATAVCADHTADHGGWAWVDGEEHACFLDLFIQIHPLDGGLHNDVHVVWVDF